MSNANQEVADTCISTVDIMIELESGDCTEEKLIQNFQKLIDSGVVWKLQGWYGRTANALIQHGYCFQKVKKENFGMSYTSNYVDQFIPLPLFPKHLSVYLAF